MSQGSNNNRNTKLWYDKPAGKWVNALPLGNGKLGAMVFGKADEEIIQLNEETIWYGGPRDRLPADAGEHFPEVRRLLFAGKVEEAQYLARMAFTPNPKFFGPYQPLGDLLLCFNSGGGKVTDYHRELDLDTAIGTVQYRNGNVQYQREMLCSAADHVLAIRFTADHAGSLSFSANLNRRPFEGEVATAEGNSLSMTGQCGADGVNYAAFLRLIPIGGTVRTIGSFVSVENADSVVLLLAAQTSFDCVDPLSICQERVQLAVEKGFDRLKEAHLADYQPQFRRVSLNLTDGDGASESLPTNERLARVQSGEEDHGLLALYFQYGRYLLLSCSRPGGQPANLQGIWNDQFKPPWECNYTTNINLQMNYWPAEVCNLAECHEPLFDFIDRLRVNGRKTARDMYGCRGFVVHHNTNLWADTVLNGLNVRAATWPTCGAWLALHVWEHYRFGGSVEFLSQRAYPTMMEAAQFFLDYMVENANGQLVTGPSASPENRYLLPNGNIGYLCMGPSMDIQIIETLYNSCIEAASILNIDESFVLQLKEALSRFPKPKTGKHGQLLEWTEDYEEAEPGHRHISHLFALHPGELIDVYRTPELAQAAKITLERRLANGGGHTGWSRAWIINFWARLSDGEEAYKHILALLRKSTSPNLFDEHPPFQIDGNFGGAAGIAEMLLQSHGNELRFLPALPQAWPTGNITGLRARGGIEVDLEWREGRLDSARLNATHTGVCRIRTEERIMVNCGGDSVSFRSIEPSVIEFAIEKGKQYMVKPER